MTPLLSSSPLLSSPFQTSLKHLPKSGSIIHSETQAQSIEVVATAAAMNALMRNATLGFSSRSNIVEPYEPFDRNSSKHWQQIKTEPARSQRTSSKRNMNISLSYRRERAKKRQIFLQSYKLSSMNYETTVQSTSRRLKKAFVKVKSVAVAVVAFTAKIDSLRVCRSPAAICASSPRAVVRPPVFPVYA